MIEVENLSFKGAERFSARMLAHYIRNPHGSILTDVIEYLGEPVGYAVFFTRKGSGSVYIQSICLLPQMRGMGVAFRYLERKLAGFRERFQSVHLRSRTGNVSAKRLYHSLGFKTIGSERAYYPNGEDALRMRLSLHHTGGSF